MKKILFILLSISLISSCEKEDDSLFCLSLLSTSPTSMQEFQENIMVTLEYQHPEGFLGFDDPDYLSLEIHDSRLTNPDFYHLQPLSPPNQTISIQGTINVEIDSPFRFGNGDSETLTYDIRIQDNKMKWSNTVTTPIITVNK